jgi:hypothetical protein
MGLHGLLQGQLYVYVRYRRDGKRIVESYELQCLREQQWFGFIGSFQIDMKILKLKTELSVDHKCPDVDHTSRSQTDIVSET